MFSAKAIALTLAAACAVAMPHAAGAAGTAAATGAASPPRATLSRVARFDHQVTGVAVSEKGRIFVNFPRWTEDVPVSVAELLPNGTLRPYPDADWNAYRNSAPLDPATHWVCVQAETADGHGSLWVIDPAAPAAEFIVPGGPKLVQIDLATDKVARTIRFDESVAPIGSYLNDVRFSSDRRFAYITDSGAKGALVVVDLASGTARRVLDGHPSTQADKSVQVMIGGHPLRRPDGRGVSFSADSISIDPDGRYLVWQALTGKTLYRIETAALNDAALTPDQLAAKVETLGPSEPHDGLWTDAEGRLYLTGIEHGSIEVREPDGRQRVLVEDPRLVWPDTFAQGPDGTLYVTNSAIQNMPWFHPTGWTEKTFNLWRIETRGSSAKP